MGDDNNNNINDQCDGEKKMQLFGPHKVQATYISEVQSPPG